MRTDVDGRRISDILSGKADADLNAIWRKHEWLIPNSDIDFQPSSVAGKQSVASDIGRLLCCISAYFGRFDRFPHVLRLLGSDSLHGRYGITQALSLPFEHNGLKDENAGLNEKNEDRHRSDEDSGSVIPTLVFTVASVLCGLVWGFFWANRFDDERPFRSAALIGLGFGSIILGCAAAMLYLLRVDPYSLVMGS